MNLPTLSQGAIGVDPVTETFESNSRQTVEGGADAALTARAVVAVSLLGAGFWYVLWKVALLVVAGR
jgi:hypothetical protein